MKRIAFLTLLLFIIGCSGKKGTHDLDVFMEEAVAQPTGDIEPIPQHEAFEVFTYSASALRSPFEPPRVALEKQKFDKNIKPNRDRTKNYLEKFDIASFSMVGHISTDEGYWGLVRNQNSIFRVKVGDYLGRNHGRIIQIGEQEIQLMEIMPVGSELWVERLRRIPLNEPEDDKK